MYIPALSKKLSLRPTRINPLDYFFETAFSCFSLCVFVFCVFVFEQSYTGASIDGAIKLNHNMADICVNWSGGLHHAKKVGGALPPSAPK